MARFKRDEILKQRISEEAGIPICDIRAQDSRELHEIASALGVQIDPAEDDLRESSSKASVQPGEGGSKQEQHTYASMLKQGSSSIYQAGVGYVKSLVIGIGEEAGVGVGDKKSDNNSAPAEEGSVELHRARANVKQLQSALKYSRNASDGGEKARKALKEAEDKVEALVSPDKGCQVASVSTLEEEASPPSRIASQAPQKGCQVASGATLEEEASIASQADLIVKTAPTSFVRNGRNSFAQHIKSRIPCTSLTRRSKEETFAEAASLPVVNVISVDRKGERCNEADVGQLMQKMKRLKEYGLGIMGAHVEDVQWVHLTGPSVRETAFAPLFRSRSLLQGQTLSFGKGGVGESSSTKLEGATKKVANFVEAVNISGSREANTRDAFGPTPADFISDVPPLSYGPISEKQAGTMPTVVKIDSQSESVRLTESGRLNENGRQIENGRHTDSDRQPRTEAENYWAFNPTPAGNKLREQLKKEEDQNKMEKERKRKRTRGQNIALSAFLNVTDPRRREKSVWPDSTCPFCNRDFPASSLEAHANYCPAVMKTP